MATQMGNQGYSNEGARECCEIIWSGDIGNVTEVHAWTNRPVKYWPQGPDVVPEGGAGAGDARLGDVAGRRGICGRTVRRTCRTTGAAFPDFGCGAIGDMACHIMGTPNMALRLTRADQRRVHQAGRQEQVHVPARDRSSASIFRRAAACRR